MDMGISELQLEEQAKLVECVGLGTKRAVAGQTASFEVDLSQLKNSFPDMNFPKYLHMGFLAPPESTELFDILHIDKVERKDQQKENTGELLYKATYSVPQKGRYALIIMWGGKHVQGSPFVIDVI